MKVKDLDTVLLDLKGRPIGDGRSTAFTRCPKCKFSPDGEGLTIRAAMYNVLNFDFPDESKNKTINRITKVHRARLAEAILRADNEVELSSKDVDMVLELISMGYTNVTNMRMEDILEGKTFEFPMVENPFDDELTQRLYEARIKVLEEWKKEHPEVDKETVQDN